MRYLAVLFAAISLRAQTPLPPDLQALTKIRMRMQFNLQHQPNYTCVETIERSNRSKTTNKLKLIDTVRLEVALVDGREMFAWPGSKKFDDFDVGHIVTTGAIGNGDFGGFAKDLFTTHSATFHYLGEENFQGKKAIRFDYRISQMLSGYRIRVAAANAIVGFHGLFYADPVTFDIERIEVIADDLPPELLLSLVDDKIDYATARIGDGDFLLPSQSDLIMTDWNGSANRNHVKFTSCRQFSGESVLTFDEAPTTKPDAASIPVREFDLPEGLEVSLILDEAIDLGSAAIGDPVHTHLERDVKQKGRIVLPKNARATGRITRLEKYENYSVVGMEFPEVEAPGILARMKGNLDSTVGIAPLSPRRPFQSRTPHQPGEGLFPVNSTQLRIARGCIIVWRT